MCRYWNPRCKRNAIASIIKTCNRPSATLLLLSFHHDSYTRCFIVENKPKKMSNKIQYQGCFDYRTTPSQVDLQYISRLICRLIQSISSVHTNHNDFFKYSSGFASLISSLCLFLHYFHNLNQNAFKFNCAKFRSRYHPRKN